MTSPPKALTTLASNREILAAPKWVRRMHKENHRLKAEARAARNGQEESP